MTKNFAHRGFRAEYPENTLLAFRKAIEAGACGIELDVHLSKDGEVVVIHDETVDRTASRTLRGSAGGSGAVKDMTIEQLKRLDLGDGEQIPTLREYFDLIENSDMITNIELKNNKERYEGMEEAVISLIREKGLEERVILSSFNFDSLVRCKELAPEIPVGFLFSKPRRVLKLLKRAKAHNIDFLHPYYRLIGKRFLKKLAQYPIMLNVWTVNKVKPLLKFLEHPFVNGIITDDPAWMNDMAEDER